MRPLPLLVATTELTKGSPVMSPPASEIFFLNQYFPSFLPFPYNQKDTDYPDYPPPPPPGLAFPSG